MSSVTRARLSLVVCLLLASTSVMAGGFSLVANPLFDDGRLGLPKTMGRDYWTVLRSSDGPYADPARKLNEKDAATGLVNLPLFRECALRHSSGRNDPTNPAWASWRKVVDNFAGGAQNEKWRCLEANAKPDVPVFVSFGAKRSKLAQVGKIDLDFDDYRAWRARHPNLVALQVGDEWGNDIYNMWCRFNNPAVCTNIWKTQGERDEVKARLFSFPFTHAGMLQRAKAYFDRVHALYWDTPDVLYACRECFCLDHVAAAWGADILSMETTNTSGGNDPEFRWDVQAAFTRGAARQFGRSWQWYVAQFVDGYNSDGRYEYEVMCDNWPSKSTPKYRPTGGCSPSLIRRICYYAYLNGANSVEMEDWGPHLLCPDANGARVLSDRGRDFAAYHNFTREHPDRGETYAPVAILLPFDQGYTYCGGWNWRSQQVEYRPGDHQVDGLFFTIVPGCAREAGIKAGKEFNLHNTSFAMMYDVLVPDSPQPADDFLVKLTAYPVAVLAGEYPDVKSFWPTLGRYVQQGGTLVVNRANVPANALEKLTDRPGADVTDESGKTFARTYDVGRGRLVVSVSDWMVPPFDSAEQAVADTWAGRRTFPEIAFLLKRLQDELFPFAVAGSCQYGANRTKDGWWLWALNNDGITKFLDTFAKVDPSAAHEITVDLKGAKATEVTELLTGRKVDVRDGTFSWMIPAGDLAIFRIN